MKELIFHQNLNFKHFKKLSSENLTQFKWSLSNTLNQNPIEIDYHHFFFTWKSTCKKSLIKLHFNKSIIIFKYPVKIPINELDEFDVKYDITNTSKNYLAMANNTTTQSCQSNKSTRIKNIFKYTYNEQEYSTRHLPIKFQKIFNLMLKYVENLEKSNNQENSNLINLLDDKNCALSEVITLEFNSALSLTCDSTHLHRFDQIQTLSEPKVIYINNTWYK